MDKPASTGTLLSLLARLSLRFFSHHRGQLFALLVSLSVGVGGVVAIVLLNQAALNSFALAAKQLQAPSTHQLLAQADGFPAGALRWLRREVGIERSAAHWRGALSVNTKTGAQRVSLDAWDTLALRRFNSAQGVSGGPVALKLRPLDGQNVQSGRLSLVLSKPLLDALTPVQIQALPAAVAAQIRAAGSALDLAQAQLLVSDALPGLRIQMELPADLPATHIELQLEQRALSRLLAALSESPLYQGLIVEAVSNQSGMLEELSRALRINLLALALLSLLVATFLVALNWRYAYLLRQSQFARLRMLGLPERTLMQYLLLEAVCVGLLSGVLGAGCGYALGSWMSGGLATTLNALYASNVVLQLHFGAPMLLLSLGGATLAALVGALWPMLEARSSSLASQNQRTQQERTVFKRWPRIASAVCLLSAFVALQVPGLLAGFAGLFLLTMAVALLLPDALALALRALDFVLPSLANAGPRTLPLVLAQLLAKASLSRLAAALTALSLALATPIGLDLMVRSFRGALVTWLDRSVPGDAFVQFGAALSSTRTAANRDVPTQQAQLITQLLTIAPTLEISQTRHRLLPGGVDLMAINSAPLRWQAFELLQGRLAPCLNNGDCLLISEALARKRGLQIGAALNIPGTALTLPVQGIFRDYRSEHGVIALPLARYRTLFADQSLSSLGLHGAAVDAQMVPLKAAVNDWQQRSGVQASLSSRAELRAASLRVFDQTFALTDQLKLLSAGIAVLGLLAALLALELENRALYQRLLKLGMGQAQLRALQRISCLLLALCAALFALPWGTLLAKLLTDVLNQRAFGWSYELQFQLRPWLFALALSAVSALVAQQLAHWFAPRDKRRGGALLESPE